MIDPKIRLMYYLAIYPNEDKDFRNIYRFDLPAWAAWLNISVAVGRWHSGAKCLKQMAKSLLA